MPSIFVIVNGAGGSFSDSSTEASITEAAARHNIDAEVIVAENGAELETAIDKALASDAEIVVASGGDGTIAAVAARLIETEKVLGVLPTGTLNHFSKDLAIPQSIDDAMSVIAAKNVVLIDVGSVNGQIFINNSSIGLYPRIVRKRDQQRQRLGRSKWHAALSAAFQVFRVHSFFRVELLLKDRVFIRKTPFVFVGNNEYQMDLFNIGTRSSLTDGMLSVYFPHKGGRWGVVKLLAKTTFGLLKQGRDFEAVSTDKLTIVTKRKRLLVAHDGEVSVMESPLEYKILPGALSVIVPAKTEVAPDA